MHAKVVVVAIGLVIAGAVVFGISRQDGAQSIRGSNEPASYGPPQFSTTPPAVVSAAPSAAGVSADIVKRLNSSDNLKAFVEHARLHPEQGGLAYATTATIYCIGVRESVAQFRKQANKIAASNQPNANRRLAAIDELERRCQGFGPNDSAIALLHEGLARGDVVLAAKERLTQVRGLPFEQQLPVAKEALALRDPQVIQDLIAFGAMTDARSKEPPVSYLDGQPFGSISPRDYATAWNVALCSFGWDCDSSRSGPVLEACAREGKCEVSYLDLLRADYVKHSERWENVVLTAGRIVAAINGGELTAFAPPAAAKPSS